MQLCTHVYRTTTAEEIMPSHGREKSMLTQYPCSSMSLNLIEQLKKEKLYGEKRCTVILFCVIYYFCLFACVISVIYAFK